MYLACFLAAASLAVVPTCAQATWSQLYPVVSPLPRNSASMACFEATGDVVLLFGITQSPAMQGWRLQGSVWSAFPAPPQIGYARGMVYDSTRERLVVFGGLGPLNDDTWEWTGGQWLHPVPALRPPARANFAMAFDRIRGVVVVYGGSDGISLYLQDLWEWNGSNWVQRAATTPLGPRAYVLAAFDPVRQNVVVHGGLAPFAGSSLVFNDTWAWDGTVWTQYLPATPPPYDVHGAMVTDLHRQRVILYGGAAGGLTREWDGSNWEVLGPPAAGTRVNQTMAYDTALRRTVMFGGTTIGQWVQDTWIYATPLPADVVPFGAGCSGSAGVPRLTAAPFALPWLGDTMRNFVRTIPVGEPGAVFVSSFGSTLPVPLGAVGMPGCDLLVPLDVVEFRPGVAGRADWTLAIPNLPSLAAASFRQQAFVFDLVANPLGLVASNGVLVTLGVR